MVYGNDNKLLYILTPEGTVTRNEGSSGTTYTYNYFKRDQVGSTRAVLSAVGTTLQNVQSTDYYPFGLAHSTNNLNKNKYLFSGKELQDGTVNNQMLGLYDFGMRQYDAIIGRWTTLDLYALKYPGVSPYNYCLNNPMNLIDPFGLEPTKDSMSDGNGSTSTSTTTIAGICTPTTPDRMTTSTIPAYCYSVWQAFRIPTYTEPASPSHRKSASGNLSSPPVSTGTTHMLPA